MSLDERIAELAAAAPPLTHEQRTRLAGLFRAGAYAERPAQQAKAS